MASSLILGLRKLVEKFELLSREMDTVSLSRDQFQILNDLSSELATANTNFQSKLAARTESFAAQVSKKAVIHKEKAQASLTRLFTTGILHPSFEHNVKRIFMGPEQRINESREISVRKDRTNERCKLIRSLNADGVILWSVSYNSGSWVAGNMGWDVFDYLLKDAKSRQFENWPPVIFDTLTALGDRKPLQDCPEYLAFLATARSQYPKPVQEIPPPFDPFPSLVDYHSFYFMSRSNATRLPEPILSGVLTSNLWMEEEKMGGFAVTNCITVCLPKTPNADSLFIARIGYDSGFDISNALGLGHLGLL
ncbi:hypothetical protein RU639_012655 [Aspergillus parasiticus]|uniref:Uncharacterized protein n=1 Tax=Aspergillus sergii TaxID=1034303 RepID=A0A5N6XJH1_9EURO|nr:hypothetical protein BDV39DRAFT_199961 [Aspergillus sergii]